MHYYLSEHIPSRFSDRMRAELSSPSRVVLPVLEVAFPSGTKRYSVASVASELGQYAPRVEEFGDVQESVSERSSSLTSSEAQVTLVDTDRELAKILAGPADVRRSAATIRWASPNVPEPDWGVLFTGVLDRWQQRGLSWQFTLKNDDAGLRGTFVRVPISKAMYPRAHEDAYGKYAPLVFGEHISTTGKGFLPTLRVDTTSFVYLVALGWVNVLDVYQAGSRQAASAYTVQRVMRNGFLVTEVVMVTDPVDDAITVDVQGYDSNADGTGDVITNPALLLLLLLNNFVFGDWKSGAWLTTSPLVDETAFRDAADYLDLLGVEGSRYFSDEDTRGGAAVDEWNASHPLMRAFFTEEGRLAVRPISNFAESFYLAEPWIRGDEADDLQATFAPGVDPLQITKRVTLQHLYGVVDSKYYETTDVQDASAPEDVTVSLSLPWSVSKV